LAYTAGKNRR